MNGQPICQHFRGQSTGDAAFSSKRGGIERCDSITRRSRRPFEPHDQIADDVWVDLKLPVLELFDEDRGQQCVIWFGDPEPWDRAQSRPQVCDL
ncbi:MAG: hypothetical protein AAFQ17_01040, partial [Pseudomonadota bacterium]